MDERQLRGQVAAADLHRRRAEAVPGEDASHRTALVQREQHQVAPVRLADAGHGGANQNARNRMQGGCVVGFGH